MLTAVNVIVSYKKEIQISKDKKKMDCVSNVLHCPKKSVKVLELLYTSHRTPVQARDCPRTPKDIMNE